MKCYGLIGYPLSHSFSGKYFAEKFEREGIHNTVYRIFPLAKLNYLPALIAENRDLMGLNVTIPYKEQVISLLHDMDDECTAVGAVNTIKIFRQGSTPQLRGYNTDVYGFSASLHPWLREDITHALILGTGGASKAAAYVLSQWGIKVTFVSRNPRGEHQIAYQHITPDLLNRAKILINSSPVGMFPDPDSFPAIPYEHVTPEHVLFDLIYNPAETKFLQLGRKQGAKTINGLSMLHLQAEKSWEIWNDDAL